MEHIDLIPLGASDGKPSGTLEVALAATGDLLLTALNLEEKPQADFYLMPTNAKRLADALLKGISKKI
jgi:hypothetical protein